MTLNCSKFKFSRNFALLRIFWVIRYFVVDGLTVKNASEGLFGELCLTYHALARLSCCMDTSIAECAARSEH